MPSLIERLRQACAEQTQRQVDPWRAPLESMLRGTSAISTTAALALLGLQNNSANARRLAKTMLALGYAPIKSKLFLPGGRHGDATRGWCRGMRPAKRQTRQGKNISDTQHIGARP